MFQWGPRAQRASADLGTVLGAQGGDSQHFRRSLHISQEIDLGVCTSTKLERGGSVIALGNCGESAFNAAELVKSCLFGEGILYLRRALSPARLRTLRRVVLRSHAEVAMTRSGFVQGQGRQTRLPPEAIERTIGLLVVERQRLRGVDAPSEHLETNREAIGYWHRELAEARRAVRAPT
jgi:hypothetical protein